MQGTFTPTSGNSLRDSYVFDNESAGRMMVKLDDDKRVDMWDHRPFSIPFNEAGLPREFTPEFVVSTKNAFYVIEVLPHSEANLEANQEKWKSIKKWCEDQKSHFAVVTEKGTFKPFTVRTAAKDEEGIIEEVAEKPALKTEQPKLQESVKDKVYDTWSRHAPEIAKKDINWLRILKWATIALFLLFAVRACSNYSDAQKPAYGTTQLNESYIGDMNIEKIRYEFCTMADENNIAELPIIRSFCN